jgi:hypothetical protein
MLEHVVVEADRGRLGDASDGVDDRLQPVAGPDLDPAVRQEDEGVRRPALTVQELGPGQVEV